MRTKAKFWVRFAFYVLIGWTLFCAYPYLSSILTPTDIKNMEERRARQIFAAMRSVGSNHVDTATLSFPSCIHDKLLPRDHILFDFAELSDINKSPTNTVLLTSKDGYLTLRLDWQVDLTKH